MLSENEDMLMQTHISILMLLLCDLILYSIIISVFLLLKVNIHNYQMSKEFFLIGTSGFEK
jgi:hypothetical protein